MPTAPSTITALPTAPSRTDPANFPARADAFVAALPTFGTQLNSAATNVYNNAVEAEADAVAAAASQVAAAASQSSAATSASTATTQAASATASASAAAASAATANTKAGEASSSAASALAIYSNTAAQQAAVQAAQAAASVAEGYAASAASVVSQDLSGVNAEALHRSPNAITAMFVYDTSKDSDGGAWTEKCQGTSWYNETIYGKWLGAHADETQARFTDAGSVIVHTGDILASATDWTLTGAVAIADKAITFNTPPNVNASAAYSTAAAFNPMVSGSWYSAKLTLTGKGQITVKFGSGGTSVSVTAPGVFTVYGQSAGATPTVLNISSALSSVNNFVGTITDVTIREVTAQTTQSGDYFQLTTDGKFYRLWKNRLSFSTPQNVSVWTATTSDLGTTAAVTFGATGAVFDGAASRLARTLGSLPGFSVTLSFTVKSVSNQIVTFNYRNPSGGNAAISYDPTTKAASITSGLQFSTPVVQPISSDTARIILPFSVLIGANCQFSITGGGAGDAFNDFQLEQGSVFTSLEGKTAETSISEVFRGNKRDFPRVAGIVAEASSVTIYDLTEPGRPMWMRFVTGGNTAGSAALIGRIATTKGSLFSSNGVLAAGSTGASAESLQVVSFLKDGALNYSITSGPNYSFLWGGNLAQRNTNQSWIDSKLPNIASSTVNAVAMTVLPDAPIDPVTGLAVPTIAVATGGGVSVIKHNGTVANPIAVGSHDRIAFQGQRLWASGSNGSDISLRLITADFTAQELRFSNATYNPGPPTILGVTGDVTLRGIANRFVFPHSPAGAPNVLQPIYADRSTRGRSMLGAVAPTYNAGWQHGSIRRTYLSDNTTGSIVGTELVTNGTFDTDTTGWTVSGNGTFVVVSGEGVLTESGAGNVDAYQIITTEVGKTYGLEVTGKESASGDGRIVVGTSIGASGLVNLQLTATNTTYTRRFTATSTTTYVTIRSVRTISGASATVDQISVRECVLDRSYLAGTALVTGTLTKSEVAAAAELVAYSGFSVSNYAQEPYSADLDFGTGEWSCSAWANIPATLPAANFGTRGAELITNGTFTTDTTGWTALNGTISVVGGALQIDQTTNDYAKAYQALTGLTVGRTYKLTADLTALSAGSVGQIWAHTSYTGTPSAAQYSQTLSAPGALSVAFVAEATTMYVVAWINTSTNDVSATFDNISVKESYPLTIAERAHTSGASVLLAVNPRGLLLATAYDGTTTRTVTTSAAYNTATWVKAEACYTTDGTLSIRANGVEVATTRGNPLLTLNNASATLTIGNSQALDAPFPGSIALLKLSATVPTPEQSVWMYEQEKQLFRAGAKCCLPDSGNIVDLTYDDATDRWIAVSAANESEWAGLVRTSVTAVPAGSYTKVAAASGIQLQARSSTNPGVDVTIPAYGLREELVRRAEAAARLNKDLVAFDYVGGFTATTVSGNTAITSVANLSYPGSVVGAAVTGSGIPAGATIVAISGTTIYLSAAATASASGVAINFTDFHLPVGYEAEEVSSAGTAKQEGATKDWTRRFDGFRETIRFGTAPGNTTWVQIQASRSVQ